MPPADVAEALWPWPEEKIARYLRALSERQAGQLCSALVKKGLAAGEDTEESRRVAKILKAVEDVR